MNIGVQFFYCAIFFSNTSICLRIVSLKVPALKQRGDAAVLYCDYDLEGGKLYSVKWYRDHEEFYRFMPRLQPSRLAYQLDGVHVDLEKSNGRRVHISDLSLRSRGFYRCEVSEEAPFFHSAHAEEYMEVFYFPHEVPVITGYKQNYRMHEPLDVNCSSPEAFPAPDLQWIINGKMVVDKTMIKSYEVKSTPQGLLMSTLGLSAPALPQMQLKCVATIGHHKTDTIVEIETNSSCRILPVIVYNTPIAAAVTSIISIILVYITEIT